MISNRMVGRQLRITVAEAESIEGYPHGKLGISEEIVPSLRDQLLN